MKLTKKQKGYLAVLVVALVAFVADRALFLPASAGADEAAQEDPANLLIRPAGTSAATAAAAATLRNPYRADLLGERLGALAEQHRVQPTARVRDAFEPSQAWVSGPKVVLHNVAAEAVQAFREKTKVKAIFLGSTGRSAVINDRRLQEGQRIGAFTLKTIGPRSVTFTSDGQEVELPLEGASSINAE
jgi:hypothetical protein